MFKYETHLHTSPVSRCAKASVREQLEFYKANGYDGVFITNHFIDGNIDISPTASYEEKINFYFSDYEEGLRIGKEIGIKVFFGAELSYGGTDFLVYGLGKEWFLAHPEITEMKKSEELSFMAEAGALIIQAHPFREAGYIDHIRLFPRHVHGVEVINACRSDFENSMARLYADNYGLIHFAGSDNHGSRGTSTLAGMSSRKPISSEKEFIKNTKKGKMQTFVSPSNVNLEEKRK